jgi:phage/plasmid-like protein (TIGR03299 family)
VQGTGIKLQEEIMSQETSSWLNQNTLIGFTEKRGKAWHYRASDQGAESNHYPDAIPVDDIKRRLFFWEPVCGDVTTTYYDSTGVKTTQTDITRKTIVRPDTGDVFGIFKQGYQPHGYSTWLVDHVETFLSDELQPASAGLLKGGAVAWVQVEAEETHFAEGFGYRPFITAATSLDGSLATTYLAGSQAVVCDNTLAAAYADKSARVKIRHSLNSLSDNKVLDVRQALGLLEQTTIAFSDTLKALTADAVSADRWARFLDKFVPVPQEEGRGKTLAANKRDALVNLYQSDERVTPWAGTALGVLQAVNTYNTHLANIRGDAHRVERNQLSVLKGDSEKADTKALELLASV